ncbi:uncharacterized protein F4807DRAFT_464933 [Annulohypoxylon truncatum]|uniref:uncharacterized protein n=1 Tax=Annulohypoxylon truncatum TaxID=327061 RepID=UPI0020074D1A|nr:uncharacterized protein F4807DRAFT_464933 [Annulohypoxylon truncatum]KAI1205113.1 hypothetical protein F4807DRAFT_464933 [Annulohypoxylon truncatum]
MATIWYCCACSPYNGCGGISSELHPACITCGEIRCSGCVEEAAFGREAEEEGSLYPWPEENGMVINDEALIRDNHEHEALRETSQPFTDGASSLQGGFSVDPLDWSYPATAMESPTTILELTSNYRHRETERISGVESETDWPSQLCEDGERTPRSGPDDNDPFDSVDKDVDVLFSHELELSLDCFPYQEYQNGQLPPDTNNTETFNIDEIDQFDFNLAIDHDGANIIEPQHYWEESSSVNAPTIPRPPEPPTLWPIDAIQPACNVPYQSSSIAPSTLRNETSPLDSLSPSPPSHRGTDQPRIARKGKVSQAIRICESCSSAPEHYGKPFACLFYKLNPKKYFTCNNKDFTSIGHVRQHIRKDHCKYCWAAFNDERSSKTHAECQPMDGKPVIDLAPMCKAQIDPNMKWYWTWKQLFGESVPLPQCPYSHPCLDLEIYILNNHRDAELSDLTGAGDAGSIDC